MSFFAKNIEQVLSLPGDVHLRLAIAIGASGAVASYQGQGLAVAPVKAVAAGTYTLTLDRQWLAFVGYFSSMKQATGVAPLHPVLTTGDGTTSVTLVFETRAAAGTPTNPASGDVIYLDIIFNETNVVNQVT